MNTTEDMRFVPASEPARFVRARAQDERIERLEAALRLIATATKPGRFARTYGETTAHTIALEALEGPPEEAA